MKMWFSQTVSGLTLALMCVATMTPVLVFAEDAQPKESRRCSDATIAGTYGIQISGTRPSAPGGPIEWVVGVVVRHYDGNGQFTQVDNVKGSISGIVPDRPGFGTYQVNEDCSAVVQLQPGSGILLKERLVIVDDGNAMFSMTLITV